MAIDVIIVEDDNRLRSGLVEIVNSDPQCTCVGAFGSGEEALAQAPALHPQVAVMDINLPGMDGIECVRQLSERLPELQIVMLTVYQDTNNLFRALAAGAHGYLVKPARARDLLAAIRDIHRGGAPMTSALARKVVDAFRAQAPSAAPAMPVGAAASGGGESDELAPREKEVLDLLAQGFSYKEIADKLNVAFATVHTYVLRIYKKLHVRSKNAAVARWLGYQRVGGW
ncbi:MAG TPA: response regulator transcription factor [Kiritimatiellia bacterium]|jgi:DNA-binding NarL/FixJ family response regulator|nr:MAG: Transcriptional regulatory protein DevR (DosR) [Verrucomicrobia bacterium ADurb.Bin070]HPB09996.1 response regulator transcription factor [Kiritimatiellia bacterium]HPO38066.1 response regulator transcription factor [Kiritimatiellia bacterium]HQA37671.1 response regulator transcription factor [Kiritimatiellia bacterium]HQL50909.1 response regulator transcription factor [Kiritimatiellia bacterium]